MHEDKVRILHAFSDLSYTFDYSLMEPLFSHQSKEVNKITIVFNEKYEQELKRFEKRLFNKDDFSLTRSSIKSITPSPSHSPAQNLYQTNHHIQNNQNNQNQLKLDLKFVTRANRDLFLYTIKAFITKREVKHSAVIRKIEKINFDQN